MRSVPYTNCLVNVVSEPEEPIEVEFLFMVSLLSVLNKLCVKIMTRPNTADIL
jgi:hypothetical protein